MEEEAEAADNNELPAAFVAVTLNVQAVPFVNPVTVEETVWPATIANEVASVIVVV